MGERTRGARRRHGSGRVASSIWLPWAAGAVLLLSLATVALVAGGRVEHGARAGLAQTEARQQALVFGVLLTTFTLGTFGWLYAMVLRPLQRLAAEAERLAYGELGQPVEIRRYDEIGLIGRSLEGIRLVLVRQRLMDPVDARTASEAN